MKVRYFSKFAKNINIIFFNIYFLGGKVYPNT